MSERPDAFGSADMQPRSTSWLRRLTAGGWELYARPEWTSRAGPDWPTRIMHFESTGHFEAKQGRSTGRCVLDSAEGALVVYLKRHYRHPRWRGVLATFRPGHWSAGMHEYRQLRWASTHRIAVPRVLAAGEFVGPWGRMQSFLAIEELTGMLPLDQAIPLALRELAPEAFRKWKKGLALELARVVRFLHERNRFHKDLYLCHFFVRRSDTARVPEWRNNIYMIDLHRFAHHPLTRTRWRSKDLGQLMFSSEIEGIGARDRLRFWRAYLAPDTDSRRWLRSIVLLRAERYRRHNAAMAARAQRGAAA